MYSTDVRTSQECVPVVGGKSRGLALFWGGVSCDTHTCHLTADWSRWSRLRLSVIRNVTQAPGAVLRTHALVAAARVDKY